MHMKEKVREAEVKHTGVGGGMVCDWRKHATSQVKSLFWTGGQLSPDCILTSDDWINYNFSKFKLLTNIN